MTGVARPIPGTDWVLVAKLDQAEISANVNRQALWIALAGLLALAVAAAVGVFFYLRQRLAAALRESEIQAEKLRALQLLDALARNSASAICVKDVEGRYQICNPAATRLVGKSAEEVLGQDDRAIFPAAEAAEIMAADRRLMAENQVVTLEENLMTPQGMGTFLTTKGPLHDADGRLVGTFGIALDITDQQRLAEELRRSNAELEQIAFVTTHDLQEPLRTVASFVQLLARHNRGRLDGESDRFIDFAVDGVRRMQALIDDILEYSRVGGASAEPVEAEDTAAAFAEALNNLHGTIAAEHADISCAPLPPVAVPRNQLILLFRNLVGNALKFRGEAAPVIQVSATPEDGDWRFCIRDNGIGIDPRYQDKIFVIFQRLHSRADYPGTGIGLALCKKIVERHGGRIWVESAPGEGAGFYFTLPGAGSGQVA